MGKAIFIFHNRAAIANKTKVQWGWIVELHALHDFKAVAQVGQRLGETQRRVRRRARDPRCCPTSGTIFAALKMIRWQSVT